MKSIELFQYLNIPFVTEGHKHCRPGWVNMECPRCSGNPGMHLGWNIEDEFFRCWRCGWHPVLETLHALSGLPITKIREAIRMFGGRTRQRKVTTETVKMKAFRFPTNTNRLSIPHKNYLIKRGFDPDYLEQEWGLRSTGPLSELDDIEYHNRILIPIYWNQQLASFQCRTTINKDPKYKTCSKDRELVHHKHILYGKQSEWKGTGICVEGVTDVWRFGSRAFATFGIEYKQQQVKEIVKNFMRVAVCFDDDPQAVRQANKLVSELRTRGISSWRVPIVGDPGDMNQIDADNLIKEILKDEDPLSYRGNLEIK
jgi:hypothetical protein